MLVESHCQNKKERYLTQQEQLLINTLIEKTPYAAKIKSKLSKYKVFEMNDGKMGSLKFVHKLDYEQQLGFFIAEAEFTDEDNVLVNIILNIDQKEEIYELDIWKTDFSSLKKFPKPKDIRILF